VVRDKTAYTDVTECAILLRFVDLSRFLKRPETPGKYHIAQCLIHCEF